MEIRDRLPRKGPSSQKPKGIRTRRQFDGEGKGGEGWIGDGREKRRGCKGKDVRYIAGYFVSIISGEINSITQSPVSIWILLEIFEEILRIYARNHIILIRL